MLILELALQNVRGFPPLYRLGFGPGLNVVHIASDEERSAILEAFYHTLYPSPGRSEATEHLSAEGGRGRIGLTFYGRDKATYRLVRDLRLGAVALHRFNPDKKVFEALTDTAQDTAQFLRVQEQLPDETDYESLCMVSPEAMATRGHSPPWRGKGEAGSTGGPIAPGMARGVSAMSALGAPGGGGMFATEGTAMDPGGMFAGGGTALEPGGARAQMGFGRSGTAGHTQSLPPSGGLMGKSALETEGGEVVEEEKKSFAFEQAMEKEAISLGPTTAETKQQYDKLFQQLKEARELEGAREKIDALSLRRVELAALAKESRDLEIKEQDLSRVLNLHADLKDLPIDMSNRVIAFRRAKERRNDEIVRFRAERTETEADVQDFHFEPIHRDRYFLGGIAGAAGMVGIAFAVGMPFLALLNIPPAMMAAGSALRFVNDLEMDARLKARLRSMMDREARIEAQFDAETRAVRELLAEKANTDLEKLIDELTLVSRVREELQTVQAELERRRNDPRMANAVSEYKEIDRQIVHLEARLLGSDESSSVEAKIQRLSAELRPLAAQLKAAGVRVEPIDPNSDDANAASVPPAAAILPRGGRGSGFVPKSSRPEPARKASEVPIVTGSAPGRPASQVPIVRGKTIPGTPVQPPADSGDDEDGYGSGYGGSGGSRGGGGLGASARAGRIIMLASGLGSGGGLGGGSPFGYGEGGGGSDDRTSQMTTAALGIMQISVDELLEKSGERLGQYLQALTGKIKVVELDAYGKATFHTEKEKSVRFGDKQEFSLGELDKPLDGLAEIGLQLGLLETAMRVSGAPVMIDDPLIGTAESTRQVFSKILGYLGAGTQVIVLTPSLDVNLGKKVEPKVG